MEILVELVIQFVVQVIVEGILEGLLEAASRKVVRGLRSRRGRLVVSAILGVAFGLAWGVHLADRDAPPRLLWVSLVLAAVAAAVLLWRRRAPRAATIADTCSQRRAPIARIVDRLGRDDRVANFLVLNLVIAAGVAAGWAAAR